MFYSLVNLDSTKEERSLVTGKNRDIDLVKYCDSFTSKYVRGDSV